VDIIKIIKETVTYSCCSFDKTAFWTFVLTLTTIALCLIAWRQLRGLGKVSRADFINKFNKDFFNPTTQKLILLLSYNALQFKIKNIDYKEEIPSIEFPYFAVNQDVIKQFPENQEHPSNDLIPKTYNSFEIDDLLLGYFEEIGCFEKDGLIGIQGVYDMFDWYIQMVWNNPTIKEYIKYCRESEENGEDIYESFEDISIKVQSFGRAKLKGRWLWVWKFKWWLSNIILKK
jgi:hypothetical protein